MSKDKISDYSTTANSNTDIGGINVDEGCAPSGINDAIRTLMAQLKTWQSGGQDVYIHPAGSASAPSITANGDTNTGIFFPAADTVGISTGGTERARVDSSGNLGLGVTPSAWDTLLKSITVTNTAVFSGQTNAESMRLGSNWYYNGGFKYQTTAAASRYDQGSGAHSWFTAASGTAGNAITFTQAMTLDASGNLGVGTTSPSSFNAAGSGIANVFGTGSNASTLAIYSGTSSSGYFYFADGTSGTDRYRGYIEYAHADDSFRFGTASTERARIDSSGNLLLNTTSASERFTCNGRAAFGGYIYPSTDNAYSCGLGGNRWSVIYAATGTINTSDANTKQDIADLDEAEKRVAVRIKSLIKKFRFKDSVAEKGQAARIHVGVIAQEVQEAFTAEGLDAGRYGLFCSDTWIDKETNEEKTRLGIRYDELLAFVIAAI